MLHVRRSQPCTPLLRPQLHKACLVGGGVQLQDMQAVSQLLCKCLCWRRVGVTQEVLEQHQHAWDSLRKQDRDVDGERVLEAYVIRGRGAACESLRVAWARKRPAKEDAAGRKGKGKRRVAAVPKDTKAWNWAVDPDLGAGMFKSWGEVALWAQRTFLRQEPEPEAVGVKTRRTRGNERSMGARLARHCYDTADDDGAASVKAWHTQLSKIVAEGGPAERTLALLRRIDAAEVRTQSSTREWRRFMHLVAGCVWHTELASDGDSCFVLSAASVPFVGLVACVLSLPHAYIVQHNVEHS